MGKPADDAWAALPLRARMPEYVALFGLGLVGGLVVGWLVGLAFGAPMAEAVGYTFLALGLFCLLGGGSAGGEYKALGLGQGAGRMKHIIDEDPNVRQDLRSARRPGRNPAAFWMVIAGGLYTAIGLIIAMGG
jgi:hypothetical protein